MLSGRACATLAIWKARTSPSSIATLAGCPIGSRGSRRSWSVARWTSSRRSVRRRPLAAKQATTTIPIVMIGIGDPVGARLVSSLARPGGNITGNTILGPDVAGKRLQLLKEVIPSLSRVAFLWNPDNASHPAQLAELQVAVQTLGMTLFPVAVRSSDEFDNAFAAMIRERPDAFLMTNDPFHQLSIGTIIDFLANNHLPGMFLTREIVVAGGFLSYGASLPDLFRRGAVYVHKILQGTKPSDLPVEQPVKFELVVNLKTAKALGLTFPMLPAARRRGDRMKTPRVHHAARRCGGLATRGT